MIGYKNALSSISKLLNTEIDGFEDAFSELKKFVGFSFASVFYLNESTLSLKYQSEKHFDLETFKIHESLREKLFEKEPIILSGEEFFLKDRHGSYDSYLVLKLVIRDFVFGVIILGASNQDFFGQEEVFVAESFSNIFSYKIKDFELSEISKLQVDALQESIVEKINAYRTIEKQNLEIKAAHKIQNDFVANISHELRTPLNAIIGFSEGLSSGIFGELNPEQLEYVNDIYTSGLHLLGMINEILDASKLEAGAMKLYVSEFEIERGIVEVLNVVRPLLLKKNIGLSCENIENTFIETDFQKFQQILYNLLSNAIKFTPEDGKIEISVKKSEKSLSVSVKDSGIGIEKKDQKRVFDKFVQLDFEYTRGGSSTGLGLFITKQLAEMMGGTISLKSAPQKGSEFILKLPSVAQSR